MRRSFSFSAFWAVILFFMTVVGGGVVTWNPLFLEKMDRAMMDRYMDSLPPRDSETPLVAILAQEQSFQELGSWPWPRSIHGDLIGKLSQARTVVVDLLFPEQTSISEDKALSDAVREHGNCVVAIHFSDTGEGVKAIPLCDQLNQSAKSIGVANLAPDIDGLYRFFNPLWNVEAHSLPSIALAGVLSHTKEKVSLEKGPLYSSLVLSSRRFPLNPEGGIVMSTFNMKDIPIYEYVDVLRGRVQEDKFKNSLVMVGINAVGLGIQDTLPMYREGQVRSIPGVMYVALSIQTLLEDGGVAVLPPWTGGILASLASFFAGILGLMPFSWGWVVALALGLVLLVLPYILVFCLSLWLPSTGALMVLCVSYLVVAAIRAVGMSRSVRMGSIYTEVLSLITSDSWNEQGMVVSPEAVLDRVWPEIEKLTSIQLLEKNLSEEEAKDFSTRGSVVNLDDSSSLIKIPGGKPPYRLLVKPAQGWEGLVVLGWCKNVSKEDLRSAMSMILSVSWFSVALKREKERTQAIEGAIKAVVAAVDAKDPETRGHSERVASLARELALAMDCPPDFIEELALGATLHDVGKIGIPDAILQKPAKLTEEEFERIKAHPSLGEDILRTVNLSDVARQALLEHHEKLDGSGYPAGLSEDEISLAGRIMAVADAFDALSSRRTYKEGWPLESILDLFDEGSGILYDPTVVEALHAIGPTWYGLQNYEI